jgi:Ni/Fe-hydrogenase subunit HybB-like protein
MHRARVFKLILWLFTGLAAAVAAGRFLFGLGATTNLSDATPWGLWIGFDVMSGVALAAGGFIVTAIVYIFRLEQFRAVVRPAVLTAFLGYVAVAVGLVFDLGLPWNMWHMIIYWNPRSPLFEVGWCVMLYLTVLALEFFPVPAEEFSALARVRRALLRIRLPLVIVGIGLSTLHQSSLGSLFLLMPYHLHPLWYSPILPVNFFVSAVGLGLLMVIFESHTTGWLYRRKPETDLLARFGGAARWVLVGYLVLRLTDLAVRGQFHHLWAPAWQTVMFWFEMLLMVVAPVLLLSIPFVRHSPFGQWIGAGLGVWGVVVNRINVGGFVHAGRGYYLPSWTELAISCGIVSMAILAFMFMVERFHIWEKRPADPAFAVEDLPESDALRPHWLGRRRAAAEAYSLAFVLAAAFGFALLSPQPAESRGIPPSPARHARGGDELRIDGNLDGFGVTFRHASHQDVAGGKEGCVTCHHMNLPRDRNSACSECHRDMYLPSDAFRHDWHASSQGAGLACVDCHPKGALRSAETAKPCNDCHKDLIPEGSPIAVKSYRAVGYVQAMHQLCIGCHAGMGEEMTRCGACHQGLEDFIDAPEVSTRRLEKRGKRVVLPPY